jgi:zinc transporter ZupT
MVPISGLSHFLQNNIISAAVPHIALYHRPSQTMTSRTPPCAVVSVVLLLLLIICSSTVAAQDNGTTATTNATTNVDAIATHDHHGFDLADKPWGDAIAASFLVQLVTLAGLALVAVSAVCKIRTKGFWTTLHEQVIPSFASGALLATTVFLLIPEGFELLEGVHAKDYIQAAAAAAASNGTATASSEDMEAPQKHGNETAWKFGLALLSGLLIPILISSIFPAPDVSECEQCRAREMIDAAGLEASRLSSAALEQIVEEQQDEEEGSDEVTDYDDKLGGPVDSSITTLTTNCDNGVCHSHAPTSSTTTPRAVYGQEKTNEITTDDDRVEGGRGTATAADTATKTSPQHHTRNYSLAASILLGDFFHNFCDGIFLGTAFLLCSKSLAWTLTVTTIYHEIAQEIADFALLTHHCGLNVVQALTANFLSGFSVMIGAVLVLSIDLNDTLIGAILIMSGGVYIYISAVECIPRIHAARKTARDTALFFACFVAGAVPIGLVLLNHGHCEHSDHTTGAATEASASTSANATAL